ncbi:MAG: antitoxin family protein [Candidatus Magnetobacterium sp. LHC-1]
MAMTFEVKVFNGLLEPLKPVDLPEGKRLTITVRDETDTSQSNECKGFVRDFERDKFLNDVGVAFDALRNNKDWEEESDERKAWDNTIADGL